MECTTLLGWEHLFTKKDIDKMGLGRETEGRVLSILLHSFHTSYRGRQLYHAMTLEAPFDFLFMAPRLNLVYCTLYFLRFDCTFNN